MKILLVAMPDTAEVMDCMGMSPSLGLVSIAGQLVGHEVRVLDLVAHRPQVRASLAGQLHSFKPDLVGLSAMTFQFDTLVRVARFIRETDPTIRLAAGGYHATLMARELAEDPELPLDYLVRGEGEATVVELVEAIQSGCEPATVAGLSFRCKSGGWQHNPDRPLLDPAKIRLPDRRARTSRGFRIYGMPMDVIETSRGCPFNCKFCSITHMYGKTFRVFPVDRVIADLRVTRDLGAKAVFLSDDNITYDVEHFKKVCRAIVDNGLNDIVYIVQVTAAGLVEDPDLVREMDRANFRIVFVGFESMNPSSLKAMRKPTSPDINRRAAALLRRHGMALIAGIIVGYPEDTRESIRENMRLFRQLRPDGLFALYLTPLPKTQLREELLAEGLVDNPTGYSAYDGFSCNIHTHALTRDELFRLLKSETLRFSLQPRQLWDNYFLRHHFGAVLGAAIKIAFLDLYNVMTGRHYARQLDI